MVETFTREATRLKGRSGETFVKTTRIVANQTQTSFGTLKLWANIVNNISEASREKIWQVTIKSTNGKSLCSVDLQTDDYLNRNSFNFEVRPVGSSNLAARLKS